MGRPGEKQSRRLLLIAAAVAFLLEVALAATSYGTNDVQTFEEMLGCATSRACGSGSGSGWPARSRIF